VTWGPKTKTIG